METEFAGRRERSGETVVPLDGEVIYALKRWLAIRPDTPGHSVLFTSTSEWGRPVTRGMVSKRIAATVDRADWETNSLTAYTFRAFFARQYPPDNRVRDYVLGHLSEPPMEHTQIADHYTRNVFTLHDA